jgi:hypothetical protein
MDLSARDHYSAEVDLALRVQGETIELMQTGHDFVILREPRPLPAGDAAIIVTVDGVCDQYPIVLHGADGTSKRVRYW